MPFKNIIITMLKANSLWKYFEIVRHDIALHTIVGAGWESKPLPH